MIRNWYNQIPHPALKTKREITKYINWRQSTKGTHSKPNEQPPPKQVVTQLPKIYKTCHQHNSRTKAQIQTSRTSNSKEPQQKHRPGTASTKTLGAQTSPTGTQPRPQPPLYDRNNEHRNENVKHKTKHLVLRKAGRAATEARRPRRQPGQNKTQCRGQCGQPQERPQSHATSKHHKHYNTQTWTTTEVPPRNGQ